jgi:hypothetical protein
VSLSVLNQRLKTETKSKSAPGRSTKRPTLNDTYIFYLQADYKKKRTRTHLFSFSAVTVK